MPRLIDDIRCAGRLQMPHFVHPSCEARWAAHATRLAGILREEIPVILIDNVAEYFFEASDQEHWDIRKHFPNLAPPFPVFWMEHRFARKIHSKECGDTDLSAIAPGARVGMLFLGAPPENVTGEGIPASTRWVLVIEMFIDYGLALDGEIQGPHGSICMAIDEHGAAIERPYMQSYVDSSDEFMQHLMRSVMGWTHPALLAISFLHCRNVSMMDHAVPARLAKRYRERHKGLKPTAYKTLVIEPLKAVLRTEGRAGAVGIQKAIHICRGHFRDYREGRGLFGRIHQLVWMPSTVRGGGATDKPPAREMEIKV
jgi:hypothetical protein